MCKKIFLFLMLLFMAVVGVSQELPAKTNTFVTDFTNTLAEGRRQQLEQKLVAFSDSTSIQITVVIVKTVSNYDINEYAQKLGRTWGVGKDTKNGMLVLVAVGDRKVSIQTGFGAEATVPDIVTFEIIKNDITPRFKQNDYYGGLDVATADLIKYLKGEYKTPKKPKLPQSNYGISIVIIILIVLTAIVLLIVLKKRGGGGGRQIYGGRGSASPFWWFLGGAMLGRGSGGWGGFSDSGGGFGDKSGDNGDSGGDFGGGGSSGTW